MVIRDGASDLSEKTWISIPINSHHAAIAGDRDGEFWRLTDDAASQITRALADLTLCLAGHVVIDQTRHGLRLIIPLLFSTPASRTALKSRLRSLSQ
jgi:hypothetical protein